ncbi:MAG: helix-turn-helix domain-containing protein [Adlercreutzia mucosicola]|nr:helix-turn-helix domain-containing protein [Adlercreutzia mucosicola]
MQCAVEMPISPKRAAELCGVGVGSIYAAIAEGSLRARHKRGQSSRWWILRSDLEAWAAGGMFGEEQR